MAIYHFPNHNPKITLEEFARGYLARSSEKMGRSESMIRKFKVIVPCDCDYEGCDGWGAVPREFAHEDYEPQDVHEWPGAEEG